MFLICLIGFVATLLLSSLLKSLGVFPFFMFGFVYCGAISILDWLCLSFSPEFLYTLSIIFCVSYIILWISQLRIRPMFINAALFIVALIYYMCCGDSFMQSLLYSFCILLILIGLNVIFNISAEDFCKRWDVEMPACAEADVRCSHCHSSRISKSVHCGVSYDHWIESFHCKKCGHYWENNI